MMLAVVRSITFMRLQNCSINWGEGGICSPDHLIMVHYWLTNMNEFRNHDQPNTSLQLKEQFFHPQQNEAANNSNCYSWTDLVKTCLTFKKLFEWRYFLWNMEGVYCQGVLAVTVKALFRNSTMIFYLLIVVSVNLRSCHWFKRK